MSSFRLVIDETSGLTRLREVPDQGRLSRNRTLRRLLQWSGAAAVVLLVLALAALISLAWADAKLDAGSRAYAQAALKAIAADWDPAELAVRSAPGPLAAAPSEVEAVFDRLARLGPGRLGPCRGAAQIAFQALAQPAVTALYDCDLDLAAGPAEADIALTGDGGTWRISRFRVNSPLLAN